MCHQPGAWSRKSAVVQAISIDRGVEPAGLQRGRPSLLAVGTIVWLGSELMFFSGLFASYFTIRAHNVGIWPPPSTPLGFKDTVQSGAFTWVLLMSSVTMQKAYWNEEHGLRRAARWWVALSLAMGGAFLANQIVEWFSLGFTPHANAFASLFFLMTGLHGLHVTIGLVAMAGLLGRMVGPGGDPGELPVFQSITFYWHFVDVVWIALYACLFLLK